MPLRPDARAPKVLRPPPWENTFFNAEQPLDAPCPFSPQACFDRTGREAVGGRTTPPQTRFDRAGREARRRRNRFFPPQARLRALSPAQHAAPAAGYLPVVCCRPGAARSKKAAFAPLCKSGFPAGSFYRS